MSVKISEYSGKRRDAQNRLAFQWYRDISEQMADNTPEFYRAFCKLYFGVGILKAHDDEFRGKYDEIIRPLPYEKKMALMLPPIEIPVTSRLNIKQMSQYLETLNKYWLEKGVTLNTMDDLFFEAIGRKKGI